MNNDVLDQNNVQFFKFLSKCFNQALKKPEFS